MIDRLFRPIKDMMDVHLRGGRCATNGATTFISAFDQFSDGLPGFTTVAISPALPMDTPISGGAVHRVPRSGAFAAHSSFGLFRHGVIIEFSVGAPIIAIASSITEFSVSFKRGFVISLTTVGTYNSHFASSCLCSGNCSLTRHVSLGTRLRAKVMSLELEPGCLLAGLFPTFFADKRCFIHSPIIPEVRTYAI